MNHGNHVHELNPFYAQAVAEHRQLHGVVDDIHRVLDSCDECAANPDAVAEVTQRVESLRHQLAQHFAHEEEGGYLEEALVRAPKLAPQAMLLQKQHREFLDLANHMLIDARRAEPSPTVWARLRADYGQFAKRLKIHENAENALLQRAFNEDMGIE